MPEIKWDEDPAPAKKAGGIQWDEAPQQYGPPKPPMLDASPEEIQRVGSLLQNPGEKIGAPAEVPDVLEGAKKYAAAGAEVLGEGIGAVTGFLGKGIRQTAGALGNVIPPLKPITEPIRDMETMGISDALHRLAGGTDTDPSMLDRGGLIGGILKAPAAVAEGLLTPENAALMLGVSAVPSGVSAALSGVFTVDMFKNFMHQFPAAVEAAQRGDWNAFGQAITEAGATFGMAVGAGKHAKEGLGAALERFSKSGAPVAQPGKVTFTDVATPDQRAVDMLEQKEMREILVKTQEARKNAAVAELKKFGPEIDFEDVPLPQTPTDLLRFVPNEVELAEIQRKGSYRDGAIELSEVPQSMLTKIKAEGEIDGLLERMEAVQASGGVGRVRLGSATDNASTAGGPEWAGIKSPLPEHLQGRYGWDDIFSIISRGRNGEDLSPKQARFYEDVVQWASNVPKAPDPARVQYFLERWDTGIQLVPVREQIAQEAVGAQERAAMQAEAEGGTGDLSAADLEFRAPTGESDVVVGGKDGEPVKPLNPPELDLQSALDTLLTRATAGGDPQKIADLLREVYDIPESVIVNTIPSAAVARTEEFPTPDGGKAYGITLPPNAPPWQVAHEVMFEVRRFSGRLHEELPHDNNIIAARVLGDLRARGLLEEHPSGLPKRGFTGAGDNPLGMVEGRTFDLDSPFPDAATREGSVPDLKNVFDPSGVLNKENQALHGYLMRKMGSDVLANVEALRVEPDKVDAAVKAAMTDFLRQQGFDGHIWQDELGRHLTVLDRTPRFEEGGPQATETGRARAGAPEEARINSDAEILEEFADGPPVERPKQQGPIDPDLMRPEEGSPGATDLYMKIPLIDPFVRHDVVPFAKSVYEAAKSLAGGLARALQPRLLVSDEFLDPIMAAMGTRNKELALYRINVGIRAARNAFDRLPVAEQIAFIDRYKQGRPQPKEMQPWADMIGTLEDHWYGMLDKEMKESGKSLNYIAHHLALIYDGPPAAVQGALRNSLADVEARMGSHRPFEGSKDFYKKMVYESLTEAMQNGLTPVSTNPFVLMELRLADNMKFLSARQMFRDLKELGAIKFIPFGKEQTAKQQMPGWRPIADRVSQVYFPTEQGMVHAGSYFWEPNVARLIDNYLGYDLVRQSKLGRGALALKNMTTAVELGLSPFHFFFINGDAMATSTSIGIRKLARGDFKGGLKDIGEAILLSGTGAAFFGAGPAQRYRREGKDLIQYLGNKDEFLASLHGKEWAAKHPQLAKTVDDLFAGGAILGMSEGYRIRAYDTIKRHWNQGNVIGVALRAFPAGAQAAMQPLFEHYIPQMKLGSWLADFGQSLIEHQDQLGRGQISRKTLARRSWDRVEDRFGEMNFDNLFWDRSMKTSLQLLFRSVTWRLGDLRALLRAGTTGVVGQARDFDKDVLQPIVRAYQQGGLRGVPNAKIKAPKLDADITWVAGVAMYTALTSAVAQTLFTWHHDGTPTLPWNSDTPLLDAVMPRSGGVDRNGRPSRLMVPSYARAWVATGLKPVTTMKHGLSAVVMRLSDVWQNKDFYGNWVYDPEAPAWKATVDKVGHVLLVPPISYQSFREARARGLSGPELAASWGGMSIASPTYFATDFEDYLSRTLSREIEGRPGRSPEAAKRGEVAGQINRKIRESQQTDIPANITDEEISAVGSERYKRAVRAGEREGLAGRANRLSLEQLLKGWKYASPEEQGKLWPILEEKVARARLAGKSPEEQERIIKQVEEIYAKRPL